jgi:predicted DsbA family dithiol-disulfide isomerase
VPFFAVDERYGVSGAQSAELLLEALTAARAEPAPPVTR